MTKTQAQEALPKIITKAKVYANSLKGKNLVEKEHIPPSLKIFSDTQQRHYDQFKGSLEGLFYLGKDCKNPSDDTLYIGISDGFLGYIHIGKVTPNGEVHLMLPDIESLPKEGSKIILNRTLRLKETLKNNGIRFETDPNKDKYVQKIKKHLESKISDLVEKI